jgi:HEAT repeat protein
MEQTKRIKIRTVSLLFVLLTVAQWVYAQGARQHAWTVLNTGLADKNSGERAIAVRVLGLLINDPQAPELAMQALADPKPEVIAAAADALGQLNYQAASPKLREILHSDEENPLMVLACCTGLARTGGPKRRMQSITPFSPANGRADYR